MGVGLLTAFVGGLVTILAPCAALLVPAFFAYAFSSRAVLVGRTLVFFAGLLVALVPLGVAAGGIGSLLLSHRSLITTVAGVVIVVLGVIQALALRFPHVRTPWSTPTGANASSPIAVFLLGAGYGLAGAGCTGPILGAVLLMSAQSSSLIGGAAMLAAYAAGMCAPVFALALVWKSLDASSRGWLRPRPLRFCGRETTLGNVISGVLCIVLGVVLALTGGTMNVGILDAASQADLESRLLVALQATPTLALALGGVGLAAALALGGLALSGRRAARQQAEAGDLPTTGPDVPDGGPAREA